jgi:phage protein D
MNVAKLRYAPEFSLTLNGRTVPAALQASISSVNYQAALEGADRVELTLVNENLRWLDHPLLALDKELTLSIGYAPARLQRVFVGEIVGHTASFPSSGVPELTIAAQDRMQRLQQGTKLRWFAVPVPQMGNYPLPDPTVAGIVSAENGLMPMMDPVSAALGVLLGGVQSVTTGQKEIRKQEGVSDYDFLKYIAAENGWEMFVEHSGVMGGHKLRFQSPLSRLAPEVTLKYGQSLVDFTPRISAVGQIASVTVYLWVPRIKTTFTVTVGWDWDRMQPTIDIRPAIVPMMARGPSDYLIEEPVTLTSAPRRIFSELIPRLNQRLTASGSTVGDPRIRAGTVLRLEGLGIAFGGLYRVSSATHAMDRGGYRTSFEARKEVWFGSIPLPQQGATPVRVTAPLVG